MCTHQCRDAAEFTAICRYAKDIDALAWGAMHTNKLYIHYRKNEQVQEYGICSQMEDHAAWEVDNVTQIVANQNNFWTLCLRFNHWNDHLVRK